MKPLFKVTKAGAHVSVQGLGRKHCMHEGVPESGAMDTHAFCWANKLLRRSFDSKMLEVTLGALSIEFLNGCQFAITGADLSVTLNGNAIKPWSSYSAMKGDKLVFNYPSPKTGGLRAYLAFDAELALDNKLIDGVLSAGDQFSVHRLGRADFQRAVPAQHIPNYLAPLSVDLIPGYQFGSFSQSSIDVLLNTEYEIRDISNRMAYCLAGAKISHRIRSLASEGIAYGAIQVPPDGQPIILLNDRQTMGGYPKLGCITRLSGAALSQRFAPLKVSFQLVSVDAARQKYKEFMTFFAGLASD